MRTIPSQPAAIEEKRTTLRAGLAAVLLALVLRALGSAVREPFFDELFTAWISSKPLPELFAALQRDSGPPLYYLLVHLFANLTDLWAGIGWTRFFSILLSTASVALVAFGPFPQRWRLVAALLTALYLPHIYFGGEARSYALTGFFIALAVAFLENWRQSRSRRSLIAGSSFLLLAACTHYYGILFFLWPVLFALSMGERGSEGMRKRLMALRESVVAVVLISIGFVPGAFLALRQPSAAIGWMSSETGPWTSLAAAPLQFGFAAPYPAVFSSPAHPVVSLVAMLLVVPVLLAGLVRSNDARLLGAITLLPYVMAAILAGVGRPVYFPMRFESLIAVPLMLWLASSLSSFPRTPRLVATAGSLLLALVSFNAMVTNHSSRPLDPFRRGAMLARARVDPRERIVVSGLSYLEVLSQRDPTWRPSVSSFPEDQAEHPGWRTIPSEVQLEADWGKLVRSERGFIWIGELGSPELRFLRARTTVTPIILSGPILIARVSLNPTPPTHAR